MSERGRPLSLWGSWWNAIELLRPAFSRLSTFLWFATIVAGMTVRSDMLGVTSIVRALNLRPTLYHRLLAHFHSTGVKLDRLTALWAQVVLRLFPTALRVNGRLILIGDGIKCPKRGKKMPAVKLLHQQSDANTKPEYIMGHSLQAVSVLVRAANSFFAVPLAARIHEGLVWSNRDRRTLLDKMLALLGLVGIATPFYFVADAYYAAAKVANGLLAQGHHLVTRVKSNAVAYAPAEPPNGKRKRGRPRRYGRKIKLKSLLSDPRSMIELASPVYGERNVMLRYRVCDLIWRPAGRLVRFVAVIHPTRGSCLLMATDLSLSAGDIIYLYGLRFKIEHSFKQAVRLIGAFAYHFWMMDMTPLRYRNGNQHLHRQPADYRNHVRRKMHAYHVFIQAGVVTQGLLQYLAVVAPKLVWDSFGSWLRTIRTAAGLADALFPLDGVIAPTFSALEIAASFLLPFVAIRAVAGDRVSGALKLELQQGMAPISMMSAKVLVLGAGWLLTFIPIVLAGLLWMSCGGSLYAPEVASLALGHLLNAAMVIALAAAAASLSEHPSTAAILVLAVTVGTWVLSFVATFQGGVWEMIAGYTPAEMLQVFRSGLMRLDLVLAAFIVVTGSLVLAAVWMRLGVAVHRRLVESVSILCVAGVLGLAISFVNLSLDVSENERNSFDEAEEALLESITVPLKITVNLAPEDPRRFDLEKQTLSKLRRTMSHVTVTYVSGSATGLFEQARDDYGEIWYELGGKRIVGRSMTRDGVLDAIYELAGLQAPQEGEAGHRGHPLSAQPVGAVPLFYVAWPLAVVGLGLFLQRRRLT